MSSPSPNPSLFAGPMLLGHLFNWCLYGFEISQLHTYHVSFPKERLHSWTARLVYTIFFLDTLQIFMATHHAWHSLAAGWGNTRALYDPAGSWIAVPLITSLISCMVQLFYARRIYRLDVSGWIVGLICTLSIFQAVSGIASAIQVIILGDFSRIREIATIITLWLGGSALCDLLITCTIVTFLAVNVTGFAQTDNVLSKLMKTTVEGGLATTGMTSLHLILFLAFKSNNLHMIASIPLSKVYSITLFAMLNARHSTFSLDPQSPRGGGGNGKLNELEAPDPHRISFGKDSPIRLQNGLQTIRVTLSRETLRDDGLSKGLVQVPLPVPPVPPPVPAIPPPIYSSIPSFERERPTRAQANAEFDSPFVPVPISPPNSHLDLEDEPQYQGAGNRFLHKYSKRTR